MRRLGWVGGLALVVCAIAAVRTAPAAEPTVTEVLIEGNVRVEDDAIRVNRRARDVRGCPRDRDIDEIRVTVDRDREQLERDAAEQVRGRRAVRQDKDFDLGDRPAGSRRVVAACRRRQGRERKQCHLCGPQRTRHRPREHFH